MVARLPPLNALRAFEVASRLMSFRDAAAELNVTPSALSYQIRQLEEHLGVELFTRLNRAVLLTEAGERLQPGLRDAFERMREAVERVGGGADDILVVSCGPAFAAKWLAPRVYRFVEAYPDLELRLSASLRLVDFTTEEVDVGIRFGTGDYPGLVVERMFSEAVLPLAAPDSGVHDEDTLAVSRLLHDDSSNFVSRDTGWPDWLRRMGFALDGTRGTRFNHADHALDAAIDGAGVAMGRLSLAMRDIAAGRLEAPFDTYLETPAVFSLVTTPARLKRQKVQTFRDWLAGEIGAEEEAIASFLSTRRSLENV